MGRIQGLGGVDGEEGIMKRCRSEEKLEKGCEEVFNG